MHDLQQARADVPQTQLTVHTSTGRSSVTIMDTAQPARNQTTADGVYAEWQQQGMSTSAIITLAAECRSLLSSYQRKAKIASMCCVLRAHSLMLTICQSDMLTQERA
eukprot:1377394-Amphidinium_carterae.1